MHVWIWRRMCQIKKDKKNNYGGRVIYIWKLDGINFWKKCSNHDVKYVKHTCEVPPHIGTSPPIWAFLLNVSRRRISLGPPRPRRPVSIHCRVLKLLAWSRRKILTSYRGWVDMNLDKMNVTSSIMKTVKLLLNRNRVVSKTKVDRPGNTILDVNFWYLIKR